MQFIFNTLHHLFKEDARLWKRWLGNAPQRSAKREKLMRAVDRTTIPMQRAESDSE